MGAKASKFDQKTEWWEGAYSNSEHIIVAYEFNHAGDVIKPGTIIRFKNRRGTFRFRCMAHNSKIDSEWIDCISVETGEWKSFPIAELKGVVKPKKSRRKKPNG